MPDREKVINGLHDIGGFIAGRIGIEQARNFLRTIDDVIELLKEDCHNCKLECLLQKYDELKEKHDAMLKEQEATIEILVKDITFHNCNNCNRKDCVIKPNAGQPVRSNCIYWLERR